MACSAAFLIDVASGDEAPGEFSSEKRGLWQMSQREFVMLIPDSFQTQLSRDAKDQMFPLSRIQRERSADLIIGVPSLSSYCNSAEIQGARSPKPISPSLSKQLRGSSFGVSIMKWSQAVCFSILFDELYAQTDRDGLQVGVQGDEIVVRKPGTSLLLAYAKSVQQTLIALRPPLLR